MSLSDERISTNTRLSSSVNGRGKASTITIINSVVLIILVLAAVVEILASWPSATSRVSGVARFIARLIPGNDLSVNDKISEIQKRLNEVESRIVPVYSYNPAKLNFFSERDLLIGIIGCRYRRSFVQCRLFVADLSLPLSERSNDTASELETSDDPVIEFDLRCPEASINLQVGDAEQRLCFRPMEDPVMLQGDRLKTFTVTSSPIQRVPKGPLEITLVTKGSIRIPFSSVPLSEQE